MERVAYHRRVLNELGQHIYILKLQGFLFFGTANALLEQIRARVADSTEPQVRYIILDFRRVTGLDSSAVISFVKGRQLAESQGITLLLANLSEEARCQFERGGLSEGEVVRFAPDLDHGLEWCENQLLEYRLDGGEYLIRQGNEADSLYFIERGGVTVYLELEGEHRVRLQSLEGGTMVGELGLYLGTKRSASAIADYQAVAYRLTRSALLAMKEQEPELAAVFHEFMIRQTCERLAFVNRLVKAMLK